MFEKYTEGARKTIFFARDEASKRRARSIAPEHLLLGLLRADPELIQRLTSNTTQSVDELRLSINAVIPLTREDHNLKELGLSTDSKEVLHAAYEASESMGHHHIGVEHLLLGLFSEESRYGRSSDSTVDIKVLLARMGFDQKLIEEKIRNDIS